jgi:hypothetical protein
MAAVKAYRCSSSSARRLLGGMARYGMLRLAVAGSTNSTSLVVVDFTDPAQPKAVPVNPELSGLGDVVVTLERTKAYAGDQASQGQSYVACVDVTDPANHDGRDAG